MGFKCHRVEMPQHDCDVVLSFPGGAELTIQARPSNADVNYNGSLDIILPANDVVCCWEGDDMEPAPAQLREHERFAKQLVMELPGEYERPA